MNPIRTNPLEALVAVVIATAVGVAYGGLGVGLEAMGCAVLGSANLWLFRALADRMTTDLANGGDGGAAGMLLAGKLVPTLAVCALALLVVHPVALVVGLCASLGVAVAAGTLHALRAEDDSVPPPEVA